MPRFCEKHGDDMYLCQKCGRDLCSKNFPPTWIYKQDNAGVKGNVCPGCIDLANGQGRPLSVYETAQRESGLEGRALQEYINRHYGRN